MDFDVVIVGAGPGGCLAARDLARQKLRVGLFDIGDEKSLGKPVFVEIEKKIFAEVGLSYPTAEETTINSTGFRVFAPSGKEAVAFNGKVPGLSIQLDALVQKMLAEAKRAGAKFTPKAKALDLLYEDGRVAGVVFRQQQKKLTVKARLVIDATGFDAALVRGLDPALGFNFVDRSLDMVLAENAVHEIKGKQAAQAVAENRHGDERVWTTVTALGNYSTIYTYLSLKNRRACVLVGQKADYGGPSVSESVKQIKKKYGFFGKKLHGGKGQIRISHSLDQLVADGFMVIGEAAGMVIPLLGSGVSSALLAAKLAAQVAGPVLLKGEPTTASLWPYASAYQRGRGAILAAINVNRLCFETLPANQIQAIFESGLTCPEDVTGPATPRLPSLSPRSLPRRISALYHRPDLIPFLARTGIKVARVHRHYQAYPQYYDADQFDRWRKAAAALFAPLYRRAART